MFLGSFLVFKYIYTNPRNWYDHYLYLAKSFLNGRVDIPDLPTFYHDKIEFEGKTYIPFPPGASFLLAPFLFAFKSITQQSVSIIVGAIDIALMFVLLSKFTTKKNSLILSIFFGFGTSFFWSSIVGTTWFFAHVVSIFFITLSLIFHFNKKHFFSGIFYALAVMTRMPMVLVGIFFLLELFKEKKSLILFTLGASILVPIMGFYDYARFGKLLETGYYEVYKQYVGGNYPYTIIQTLIPNAPYFGYFDIRNIPLHLYTFLIMPPNITVDSGIIKEIVPSPFGTGILYTSPLLFYSLAPNLKNSLQRNLFLAALFGALPSFTHYMQGWVQFGYRFVLDFIVFLMIILAIKFRPTKKTFVLVLISLIVNIWGVIWAINLGW